MKLSIVINLINGYKDIDNNLNYLMNNIDENIEIIFVNYDLKCKKNFVYENYNGFKNIKIFNYKKYDISFINNILINLILGDYIFFLDMKHIKKIGGICKLDLNNKDIIAINFEQSKKYKSEYIHLIYKKEFIYKFGLFFRKSILDRDYLQIIKSVLFSIDILYINNLYTHKLIEKSNLIKIIFDELIDNINCNIDSMRLNNKEFILFIYDILYFIDFNNFYNERAYLVNKINKIKLSMPIDLSIQIDVPRLFYLNNLNIQENKNLFLVHTPYHILLAASMCISDKYRYYNNEIFIINQFNLDEKLIEKLNCIFKEVYILDKESSELNLSKHIEMSNNIGYTLMNIDKALLNNKYNNIFINNESEVQIQYILNTRLNKNGNIVYIEDGTANYIYINHIRFGIGDYLQSELSKILGMPMEDIHSLGAYSRIKERYFLYPNLINSSLKDRKPNNSIDGSLLYDAINILYKDENNSIDYNNSILLALEHSNFVNLIKGYNLQVYIDIIKDIIDAISNLNKNIYIKYHPRETNEYINEFILNYENVIKLDKNIPIESLFMNSNVVLISLKSTSLITFCKLLGSKNAICIQDLINQDRDELSILFEKLGVYFPKSINDIILKIK